MKTIRRGVFETNSSSVHVISITSEDTYLEWVVGDSVLWDTYYNELVPIVDADPKEIAKGRYMTYEQYDEYVKEHYFYEYKKEYRTKSGDNIVVFGHSGYD